MPHDSTCQAGTIQSGSAAKPLTKCQACDAVCCRLTVTLQPEDNIPEHVCRRFVMGGAYCNAIRTRGPRSIPIAVK